MSLRFFADHCVSNSVIAGLRNAGHEAFLLKEHIPPDSDDPVVLAKAQELRAVLISLNGEKIAFTLPTNELAYLVAKRYFCGQRISTFGPARREEHRAHYLCREHQRIS